MRRKEWQVVEAEIVKLNMSDKSSHVDEHEAFAAR